MHVVLLVFFVANSLVYLRSSVFIPVPLWALNLGSMVKGQRSRRGTASPSAVRAVGGIPSNTEAAPMPPLAAQQAQTTKDVV
jgi:hypothetical protein